MMASEVDNMKISPQIKDFLIPKLLQEKLLF